MLQRVGVAIVLYGPKAAGKTEVARRLRAHLGVQHVDPDALVLEWVAEGMHQHPVVGWRPRVDEAVREALQYTPAVSVEATGAYESDWQLADGLRASGVDVITVWLHAPWEVCRERLRARTEQRVPITEDEARRIYFDAARHASGRTFDLQLDTTGPLDGDEIVRRVQGLLTERGYRRG
jgi:shikimate kinase